MTTSTLELVDWATILDDEPGCEMDDCGATATHIIRSKCGCGIPSCAACVEAHIAFCRRCYDFPETLRCADCHALFTARSIGDLLKVVPL